MTLKTGAFTKQPTHWSHHITNFVEFGGCGKQFCFPLNFSTSLDPLLFHGTQTSQSEKTSTGNRSEDKNNNLHFWQAARSETRSKSLVSSVFEIIDLCIEGEWSDKIHAVIIRDSYGPIPDVVEYLQSSSPDIYLREFIPDKIIYEPGRGNCDICL